MPGNQATGGHGELDVVEKVPCPNCRKQLMRLPPNYPLYDIQCVGCLFRAQVKTNNCKPKNMIFGAGWDIIEKVITSGYMIPPLIANFRWVEGDVSKQKILFYPFVPKSILVRRQLSPNARRANYRMFNYSNLLSLPHIVLYEH